MNGQPQHTATALREEVVEYLRSQYLGPAGGPDEELPDRPDRQYLVGTLYPKGRSAALPDPTLLGTDSTDEGLDQPIEMANAWYPASAAVSFLYRGRPELTCHLAAGCYGKSGEGGTWRRSPLREPPVILSAPPDGGSTLPASVFDGRANLVSVWRPLADGWLVTVAIENAAVNDDAEAYPPTEECLFQVELRCQISDGEVLPYPSADHLSDDAEDQELRLMYRDRQSYAVGHGCSVEWGSDEEHEQAVRWVALEMMPTTIVRGVKTSGPSTRVMSLAFLADESLEPDALCGELTAFVQEYASWIKGQRAHELTLPADHRPAANRLLQRMDVALNRMHEGIESLREDNNLLAFRLANAAMREQILQTQHQHAHPGRRGAPMAERDAHAIEPRWRPFQLAFLLMTIPSMANSDHQDREVVDLIWFPTGGGKTEAYLTLAAFELVRRRLVAGSRGGGTAVLTRYTLRLLTTQQFQRAATLICALEQIRTRHPSLGAASPFSIGLWVGEETTPNSFVDALDATVELKKASRPESPFQVEVCPWCATPLFPEKRSTDSGAYGVRADKTYFALFCTHTACDFHSRLPVLVVDEQIFQESPSMIVATVDKLARLPWVAEAGAVLGRNNTPYDPPSLIIQDELHLLSGPLGTTVAIYESAIQSLIGWDGVPPKIVASTATIRSAPEQVQGLFGSRVALFPPSGLSADDSFFAVTDHTSPGRLYLGVMPQAHTQAFATVIACVALLQAPRHLGISGETLDAYWTVVGYHNSLRELGRTVTIVRDDVESMLRARATAQRPSRTITRDGVIELTSNVPANQLLAYLRKLEAPVGHPEAVDFVATTNMLSVGIDISRLGVMLMNGQPKTTAEYIQATSRVGRSAVPGIVVDLLRATKPRDRSHYESFRSYHESLYRFVEPTSVTPWSLASRDRSLRAALVLLVRHGVGLRANEDAGQFRADDPGVKRALQMLAEYSQRADPDEAQHAQSQLDALSREWERRARDASDQGHALCYRSSDKDRPALLRDFGQGVEGWSTANTMRSVERNVRVVAMWEQL